MLVLGSRGSSTGSSTFNNCYPIFSLWHKAFWAVGSRGSSSGHVHARLSSSSDLLSLKHCFRLNRFRLRNLKYCYLCYPGLKNPYSVRVYVGSSTHFYCYPYCYLCYPNGILVLSGCTLIEEKICAVVSIFTQILIFGLHRDRILFVICIAFYPRGHIAVGAAQVCG